MAIREPKAAAVINGARSGLFWDITSYMDQLPNLKAHYDKQTLINASIDGKLHGLPVGRALTRDGFIIRKDWLKNVGMDRDLTKPITLDEVYQIAKAFAHGDPDKNGVNGDTIGLISCVDGNGALNGYIMDGLDVAHGGGNRWEEDGKGGLLYTYTTQVHLESLNWLKRMYDEGIINRDFAAMSSDHLMEAIDGERAGLYFQTVTNAHERHDNLIRIIQAKDPDLAKLPATEAKVEVLDIITRILDKNGNLRATTEPGFNGFMAFAKSSSKTEADLMRALKVFDKFDSPEGQSAIMWGIKDKHYTLDSKGEAVMTDNSLLFAAEVQPYWQIFTTNRVVDRASLKGYVAPMYTKVYSQMASLLPYAVFNLTIPLTSDTYTSMGSSLDKIIFDAQVQYIMGRINENGWWDAVNRWKREGGNKITAEYSEQYRRFNK
jgi:putative aldouronate transport system substrate-binding protein